MTELSDCSRKQWIFGPDAGRDTDISYDSAQELPHKSYDALINKPTQADPINAALYSRMP